MDQNNKPKATMEDFRTLETLTRSLYTSFQVNGSSEESELTAQANQELNDFVESRDWFPTILRENGKEGVLDLDGSILVPAIFDKVAYTYSRVVINASMPIIVINDGKYGLALTDGKGNLLLPCEHDDIRLDETRAFFHVTDGGKTMLVSPNGKRLTPQTLDKVYDANSNIVVVQSGDKYGLLDLNEVHYIDPIYDDIDVEYEDYVVVLKDGIQGYLSSNDGHFIPKDPYDNSDDVEELVMCY